MKILTSIGLSITLTLTGGCALLGSNPKPPSPLEAKAYNIQTNVIPITELRTNVVTVTETQIQTVVKQVTNEQNVVQYTTNIVPVTVPYYQTNVVQVPAFLTNYTFVGPSDSTKAGISAASALINSVVPGAGGIVGMGLTALFGLWGYLRSSKMTNTSTALTQEIEAILEFVKALPNGTAYEATLTDFLQKHQGEADVLGQVTGLLEKEVSNPDAKIAAQQIINTLNSLKVVTTPIPPVSTSA